MSKTSSGKKAKVCIVSISLAGGGAERSTALLSQMLASQGYQTTIALVHNKVDYAYTGEIYDIGMSKKPWGIISTIGNLLRFRSFLKKQQFDIIIDNRSRPSTLRESVYSGFLYKGFKVLYVVRSYHLGVYFPKSLKMVQRQAKRALGYVGVSKAIAKNIQDTYGIAKVHSIYNPIQIASFDAMANENVVEGTYILAVGRLFDDVKNFSLLLEAFAASDLPKSGIGLKIVGEGPDKAILQQKIVDLKLLPSVQLCGFNQNPFPFYKNALCTTLTSHYEGFPRALIESLAVGTPVVSVDCKSGPSEIIKHGENGLLVRNYDTKAFAQALNNIIFDQDLYKKCKENAKESVAHLDVPQISKQWDQLLQKLL